MNAVEISDQPNSQVSISQNTVSSADTRYTRHLKHLPRLSVPARMVFNTTWHNLFENVEELPSDATVVTPLSPKAFCVTDVQEPRVLIQHRSSESEATMSRIIGTNRSTGWCTPTIARQRSSTLSATTRRFDSPTGTSTRRSSQCEHLNG